MSADRQTRQVTAAGIITATLGVVLFAWFVKRIGPHEIWAGFRQVGWGVLIVSAIAGLRFAARAIAWISCLERPHRLPFDEAFAAVIAGDAFGNLTPLGPIVGEPAKIAFVRDRVAIAPALTALAIENVLYTLSAAAMIAAAMLALVFTFDLPADLRHASEVAVIAVGGLFLGAVWILWRRPLLISGRAARIFSEGGAAHRRIARLRAIESDIYTFASRHPRAVALVILLELTFHTLGVLEVHVTWWLMQGSPPPLLTSFILEGANRLITVVFKVVPLRVGVDEAGTAVFTGVLGYGAAPGATLAIVRKVRVLIWTLAGTLLLVRRGLTPRRILREAELGPASES